MNLRVSVIRLGLPCPEGAKHPQAVVGRSVEFWDRAEVRVTTAKKDHRPRVEVRAKARRRRPRRTKGRTRDVVEEAAARACVMSIDRREDLSLRRSHMARRYADHDDLVKTTWIGDRRLHVREHDCVGPGVPIALWGAVVSEVERSDLLTVDVAVGRRNRCRLS